MCLQAVPDNLDRPANLFRQRFQELYNLRALDRPVVHSEVAAHPRQTGYDRNVLPVEVELENRRFSNRCPGANPGWPLGNAGLIDKHDHTPFFLGFFLIFGQVFLRHN